MSSIKSQQKDQVYKIKWNPNRKKSNKFQSSDNWVRWKWAFFTEMLRTNQRMIEKFRYNYQEQHA